MKAIRSAWAPVREHRRAYLILNLAYYGLMVVAMVYAALDPALQKTVWDEVGEAFGTGPLGVVGGVYGSGKVLLAAGLTFAVNIVVGSFVLITLPSLIVPFSGLLVGAYRAVLWGLMFSPTAVLGTDVLLHLPTLILEGAGIHPRHAGGLRAGHGLSAAGERGRKELQAGLMDRGEALRSRLLARGDHAARGGDLRIGVGDLDHAGYLGVTARARYRLGSSRLSLS